MTQTLQVHRRPGHHSPVLRSVTIPLELIDGRRCCVVEETYNVTDYGAQRAYRLEAYSNGDHVLRAAGPLLHIPDDVYLREDRSDLLRVRLFRDSHYQIEKTDAVSIAWPGKRTSHQVVGVEPDPDAANTYSVRVAMPVAPHPLSAAACDQRNDMSMAEVDRLAIERLTEERDALRAKVATLEREAGACAVKLVTSAEVRDALRAQVARLEYVIKATTEERDALRAKVARLERAQTRCDEQAVVIASLKHRLDAATKSTFRAAAEHIAPLEALILEKHAACCRDRAALVLSPLERLKDLIEPREIVIRVSTLQAQLPDDSPVGLRMERA